MHTFVTPELAPALRSQLVEKGMCMGGLLAVGYDAGHGQLMTNDIHHVETWGHYEVDPDVKY